jgi:HEAT repeat protein
LKTAPEELPLLSRRTQNRWFPLRRTLVAAVTAATLTWPVGAGGYEWPGRLTEISQDLESPSSGARAKAVSGLATFNLEDVRAPLLRALGDPAPEVQIAAIRAFESLGATEDVDELHPLLSHPVAAVRVQTLTSLGEIGTEESQRAVLRTLGDNDANVRKAAVETLGRLGYPRGLAAVAAALSDPDPEVVIAAMAVLGRSGDSDFLFQLLDKTKDSSHEIQQRAVTALAALGDPRAVPPLAALLANAHPDVELAVVEALGTIGDPRATPDLVRLLWSGDSQHAQVRLQRAVVALGKIGATDAVPALLQVIRYRKSGAPIAAEALKMIGAAGSPTVLRALRETDDRELQRTYLDVLAHWGREEPDPAARRTIAETLVPYLGDDHYPTYELVAALVATRDRQTVGPLLHVLVDLANTQQRGSEHERSALLILTGLQEFADDALVGPIIELYPLLDSRARQGALTLLGRSGSREALPILAEEVHSEDPSLRQIALAGLGTIEGPEPGRVLLDELETATPEERNIIGLGLAKSTSPQIFAELLKQVDERRGAKLVTVLGALSDHQRTAGAKFMRDKLGHLAAAADPQVASRALDGLGPLGDDSQLPIIAKALGGGDSEVRAKAVQALGDWHSPRSFDLLATAAKDANPRVRGEAAWALGQLGDPRAVPILVEMLEDRPWPVAINAAAALGYLGHPSGIEPLTKAVDRVPGPVRANALIALNRLGNAPSRERLLQFARRDLSPRVSEAVYRILAQRGAQQDLQSLALARDKAQDPSVAAVLEALLDTTAEPAPHEGWMRYVIGHKGRPDVAKRVLVALPDGVLLARLTDLAGEIRVENVPPGPCRIFFLDNVAYRVVN